MKLRLRGEAEDAEMDWPVSRPPSHDELVLVKQQWYQVAQVIWAINPNDGQYDVGLVLRKVPEPDLGVPA